MQTVYIWYRGDFFPRWGETPRREDMAYEQIFHADADEVIQEYAHHLQIPDDTIIEVTLSTKPLQGGLECQWEKCVRDSDEYSTTIGNKQFRFTLCDSFQKLFQPPNAIQQVILQFWVVFSPTSH